MLNNVKKSQAVLILIIAMLLCSAYSNTFFSPIVLDDFHTFVFPESLQSRELSLQSFAALAKTPFGWQRWIPMLTFSFDFSIGRGEIYVFHLTNLIIHILCTLAVMFLIFNVFQAEKGLGRADTTPSIYYALWVAGLWALNPVQTNAVTYLVQRMASIQALFFTASVAFYVLGRRYHNHCRARTKALFCYQACLLASIAAFLSKENSAMLPIMLLATEVWFFTPELYHIVWKWLKPAPKVVWALLAAAVVALALYSVNVFQDLMLGYGIRHFTMAERLLTEARVIVWYISLFLWPAPSRLSIEHDVLVSSSLIHPPSTLGAIGLIAFSGWLVFRYRERYPLITYGGL